MYKTISPKAVCIVSVLFYIANAYILGNDRIAGRNSWLCVALAALSFLPVFLLFAYLSVHYPGKDFFEILEAVFGKTVRKILAAIYAVYGIVLLSMSFDCFARFVSTNILPDTPKYVMATAIALCCTYLVAKGTVVLGKWASFVLPVVLLFILISLLGSVPSLHPEYLLPVAENKKDVLLGTYRYLSFPFGEPLVLFSLLSCVRGKFRLRHWLIPWFLAALILSLSFARDTMVLGGSLSGILSFSTNHADSVSGYMNFEQRTEVLTSLIPAAAGILEAAVSLLFVSQGIHAVLEKQSARVCVFSGVLAGLLLCFFAYQSDRILEVRDMIWPVISVFLQIIFPLAAVIAGAAKSGMRRKILARRLKRQIM